MPPLLAMLLSGRIYSTVCCELLLRSGIGEIVLTITKAMQYKMPRAVKIHFSRTNIAAGVTSHDVHTTRQCSFIKYKVAPTLQIEQQLECDGREW